MRQSPRLSRDLLQGTWSAALLFVTGALVVLAVVPVIVGARVRHTRADLDEWIDPAQIIVNRYELALTSQTLALAEIRNGNVAGGLQRYGTAVASERREEQDLARLVPRVGIAPARLLSSLLTQARTWRQATDLEVSQGRGAERSSDRTAMVDRLSIAVLTAAEHLDTALGARATDARMEVRDIQRLDVTLPVLLVPIAVAAALVAMLLGRRLAIEARRVEEGHRSLRKLVAAKSTLLRGITHDVKNPLGAALGYSDLLRNDVAGPLTTQQRTVADRIQRLLRTSITTLDQLLEVWLAESGHLAIHKTRIDVNALARDAAADFEGAASVAGLRVAADTATDVPPVVTDGDRVRQIVGNLVSNAIKYTPAGGRITLKTIRGAHEHAGQVGVAVCDTGVGIAAEDQQRIFDEFFRAAPNAREVQGVGIGLAMSLRLTQALGGSLDVISAPNQGSQFTLWLPA